MSFFIHFSEVLQSDFFQLALDCSKEQSVYYIGNLDCNQTKIHKNLNICDYSQFSKQIKEKPPKGPKSLIFIENIDWYVSYLNNGDDSICNFFYFLETLPFPIYSSAMCSYLKENKFFDPISFYSKKEFYFYKKEEQKVKRERKAFIPYYLPFKLDLIYKLAKRKVYENSFSKITNQIIYIGDDKEKRNFIKKWGEELKTSYDLEVFTPKDAIFYFSKRRDKRKKRLIFFDGQGLSNEEELILCQKFYDSETSVFCNFFGPYMNIQNFKIFKSFMFGIFSYLW